MPFDVKTCISHLSLSVFVEALQTNILDILSDWDIAQNEDSNIVRSNKITMNDHTLSFQVMK
jgi:hypothetical protein